MKQRQAKMGDEGVLENGYVMRVFENGVVVFVPKFGIEGIVRLEDFDLSTGNTRKKLRGNQPDTEFDPTMKESEFEPEKYTLTVFTKGNRKETAQRLELFQEVRVRVSSEAKGGTREKGKRRVRMVVLR